MVEPAAETQRKFDYAALGRTKGWKFSTGKIWVVRWEILGVTHSILFWDGILPSSVISPIVLRSWKAKFYYICAGFFSSCWRQKEKRRQDMDAVFGDVVRGYKVRIQTFNQASGKFQWSCCCEYLLASLTLVLPQVPSPIPNSNQALPYFTATVPLSRGCSGAWQGLVWFGWYFP